MTAKTMAEHSVAGMSGGTHLACRCNRAWVPHAEYPDYGLEDIVRYGAYSAEANTTATWLRTKAAKAAS